MQETETIETPIPALKETRQPSAKLKRNKLFCVSEQVVHAYTVVGKTVSEIADFFVCSDGTVRNLLLIRGVTLRARGRRKQERVVDFKNTDND